MGWQDAPEVEAAPKWASAPEVAAAPRLGMGDVRASEAARVPGALESAVIHGANGLALGQEPRLLGLYRAGEGEESGSPLEAIRAVVRGAYRKLRGDPMAESRATTAEQEARSDLTQGMIHHPVASIGGEGIGGAMPAGLVASAVPAVQGAKLLPRALTGMRQGAAVGATYGLGAEDPIKGAAEGLVGGAVTGAAAPVIAEGVSAAARKVGGILKEPLEHAAEGAAVRSANADRTATRRAFKGSEDKRLGLGRFMLDTEMPLRSPQAIRDASQEMQRVSGPMIDGITQRADATGATVDLGSAVNAAKASRAVARLQRNTKTRAAYDEIATMLDDQLQQHGGNVPPSTAHDIRMQLDELADWDKAAPSQVKRAWRAAREAVDDHLDATMDKAGLGADWAEANGVFAKARLLSNPKTRRGLADIGAERREGNRFGSPSEKGAAIAGGVAAAMHNPAVGVALPAATWAANRYAMPVTARAADALSKVAGGMAGARVQAPQAVTVASLEPAERLARAMADAMRRRTPTFQGRLSPAAADEDEASQGP